MKDNRYLCMYRGGPRTEKPSPAQMQEMFAAFNAWKDQFQRQILDLGSKLESTGRVVRAEGVSDGPSVEAKEIVGGFMILTADDYEGAVAVVRAMPGMQAPGASVEIRKLAPL